MMAWAFETVGVTPSKVKGSAVKSNAVVMRSFFMSSAPREFDPLIVQGPASPPRSPQEIMSQTLRSSLTLIKTLLPEHGRSSDHLTNITHNC
jgi:hypothetical protein